MARIFTKLASFTAVLFCLIWGCSNCGQSTKPPPSSSARTAGARMDQAKKKKLIESVSSQESPEVVSIDRFFDGNNDQGSIGCNLVDHPGIDRFRSILTSLAKREDVVDVYAQISELDPGDDSWPFSETVLVVGTISPEELGKILLPLEPDEIGTGKEFGARSDFIEKQRAPVLAAWWD